MTLLRIVLAILLFVPGAAAADASVFVTPDKAAYELDETFEVDVRVNTGGTVITAAEATLLFDPNALAVEDVSTVVSILSLWPTPPEFSNEEGIIRFSGWGDRFLGEDGLLVRITFRALRTSTHSLRFDSGAVLAADGQGSNIITSMHSGVYVIGPRRIAPEDDVVESQSSVLGASTTAMALAATTTDEERLMTPMPAAPTFFESSREIPVGDHLVLEGTTEPGTRVSILFQQGSADPVRIDVASEGGTFTFVSDDALQAGVYRVWAVARDSYGRESEKSERVTVTVRHQGLAAAAYAGVDVVSAMLPLISGLAVLGFSIAFIAHYRTRRREAQ